MVKKLAEWREVNRESIQPLDALLQKYGAPALLVASNIPDKPQIGPSGQCHNKGVLEGRHMCALIVRP